MKDIRELARLVLEPTEISMMEFGKRATELAQAVLSSEQPDREGLDQLLQDMRCDVIWTHKATMPIPLYERIKTTLKSFNRPTFPKPGTVITAEETSLIKQLYTMVNDLRAITPNPRFNAAYQRQADNVMELAQPLAMLGEKGMISWK